MKRYLFIEHWMEGTFTSDELTKKHLADLRDRMIEAIVDLENATYFDSKENKWSDIKGAGA